MCLFLCFATVRRVLSDVKKWRPAKADRGFTFLQYNLTIAYHRTNLLAQYGSLQNCLGNASHIFPLSKILSICTSEGTGKAGEADIDMGEGEDSKKHAELLALPHGSEVFLGGIHNATEEDLRSFCETIGEVTEVRIMKGKEPDEKKAMLL